MQGSNPCPPRQTIFKGRKIMTEQFLPTANESGALPAPVDPTIAAQLKLAKVTQRPEVLSIIQASALWQQAAKDVKQIETEQDYQTALKLFTDAKAAFKYAEDLRHGIVDVPTKFSKLVNDMFRPLKTTLKGVIDHFSSLTSAYFAMKEREAAEQAKEAEKVEEGPVEVVDGDGVGKVEMEAPVAAPPATTVRTGSGQVQMRTYLEAEVDDPLALLKAIVSKGEKNEIYTVDMVEFKLPVIKAMIEENPKRRKHPGIKWEKVKRAV